jgi:hypothetical protein
MIPGDFQTHTYQWNTPSIDFYEKKLKATKMDDWVGMRLEEDGIEELTKFAPE